MGTQIITTLEPSQFRLLISECISQTIQQEISHLLTQTIKPQKQILTRQETASLLGISLPTLHNYTLSGLIKAHRLGHKVRYRLPDVYEALTLIKVGRNYAK